MCGHPPSPPVCITCQDLFIDIYPKGYDSDPDWSWEKEKPFWRKWVNGLHNSCKVSLIEEGMLVLNSDGSFAD
jgi:hypothetical protein